MPKAHAFRDSQLITFSMHHFGQESGYFWVTAHRGQTCAIIAMNLGYPDYRGEIAKLNHVAAYHRFKHHTRVKVPNVLKKGETLDVMGDDMAPPTISDGYALLQVVARPGMVGVAQFMGYNPLVMDVPVRFQAVDYSDALGNEMDIMMLERMAGRGNFAGSGRGAPPVLRLTTTDNNGNIVPLIPLNYQWNSSMHTSGPLWRIQAIKWDTGAWRNRHGRRISQSAVVTMWEFTPITLQTTLVERAKSKHKHK